MTPEPIIMQAVERLDYRVTAGDIASQAGIDIKLAEQGLLVLASEAGGHLQVAETGEIAYLFPKNFRTVLQSKYLRLRLRDWWSRVWKVLFYLIRISFGVVLVASIVLLIVAITVILLALSASRGEGDRDDGGMVIMPNIWFGPDIFWLFSPNYERSRSGQRTRGRSGEERQMNFLESIFSFLFGDGDPNADLEKRRWRSIATIIRNNNGAIVAEQISPYLDDTGSGFHQEYEEYMLPVLTRFNGRPEVSPEGQIIYHFPELQVMANRHQASSVPAYLKEMRWRFSEASASQLTLAAGLGVLNLVLAIGLGVFIWDGTLVQQLGSDLITFVAALYPALLAYGSGFLGIPAVRYFWLKGRNRAVETRNEKRQLRAQALNQADLEVLNKITYARQFASETIVDENDLAYTSERDLTEQELLRADKVDDEWRRRLEQSNP